jgi:hypothetical protein
VARVLTTHELAQFLLNHPNMPVSLVIGRSIYIGNNDEGSHGQVEMGILRAWTGDSLAIGSHFTLCDNRPNWGMVKILSESHYDYPTCEECGATVFEKSMFRQEQHMAYCSKNSRKR